VPRNIQVTTIQEASSSVWLAVRSLIWTILLPGTATIYLPWRFFRLRAVQIDWRRPSDIAGMFCVIAGAALLAACIVEFARSGRGTLSPLDPPRRLVVRGLYRYVRNPMYVGVTTVLVGETLLVRSTIFVIYLITWFVCVNLFVMGYEEPTLRRRFGASYNEYTRRVRRWIPTFPSSG
jgi:protein-S-isoprenylcysteine O-methyltransferase Ste14